MIDKFKAFLAGKPHKMDEDWQEQWAYFVGCKLPSILRTWYDPEYGDVWERGGSYYENTRLKLAGLSGFKKSCAEAGDTLQALKLLVEFFEDEKRKAGLGKTTKKRGTGNGDPFSLKLRRTSRGTGGGHGVTALPVVLEEGEIKEMHIAKCERNPKLRKACIEYYRAQNEGRIACVACGMAFGDVYGEIGEGYIEVHHLNPISQIEGVHAVDPKTDLVPLCANCHAMIHRLMSAEKKNGVDLEGGAALVKLRGIIGGGCRATDNGGHGVTALPE